ncbi:MAG: PQQ-binding-like beta-propeller repeat protein [Planctomycetes bacterium]|nr:PQQ-binding-like beta-propeller repeat protein [Planctomycetota bacterium]
MNCKPTTVVFSVLAALLATVLPLYAQEDARYPMSGAQVNDNRQAADKFDRATGFFKAGRWDEGAGKLLELGAQFGEKLVLYGQVGQYVSARQLVARIVRDLPPEGVAAWRRAVDARVAALLDASSGPRDLRRILRDYPNATQEPEVRRRLARQLGDEGDIEGEADALWGMVEWPGDGEFLAGSAARLAHDLGVLNDREGLDDLEKRAASVMLEKVLLRGRESTVRESIKLARALLRGAGDDAPAWAAWPTFGGSGSRDRIAAGVKGVSPPTARYALAAGPSRPAGDARYGSGRPSWNAQNPESMPIAPAIADGIVLVNEGHVAWAAELAGDGDRRLWTYRGLDANQLMFEERALHGATLAGGLAYFTIATSCEKEQRQSFLVAVYPIPVRRLACVDAQTGRKIWEKGGDAAGKDFEKRASYHGAPVVDGDRLYCAATYWATPTDPAEHWVVCLDSKTGKEIWRTFVASGIQEINLFNNATRESVPHSLTVTGDRIYTCTNLGVIACLDRSDGGMLWARRYPRFRVQPVLDPWEIPRLPVTWLPSPIYVAKDPTDKKEKVVVAPLDGPYVFCLSADDGDLLSRFIPQDDAGREDASLYRYVLGVRDGYVVLSGRSVMAIELGTGKRKWSPVSLPSPPVGRGLIAADGVYFPLRSGLLKVGLKDGSTDRTFTQWPVSGMAGHLHFVDQAIVACGNSSGNSGANSLLTICYDPEKARAFLESEILKNPDSAYLRYRLALCFLSTGDTDRAEQSLRQALTIAEKRTDEGSRSVAEACRRTLLHNRMAAAAAMLRKSDGGRRAAEEYEKARAFAETEGEWLQLLSALADARRAASDLAGAVAVLQEIIEKHGDQLTDSQEPARLVARRSIDSILAAGREPYAAVEKEAAALLAKARANNDPAAFEELLLRFPNSLAAEDASFGAGHARFAASDWAAACDALQRFLRDHPQSSQGPQAMAELAVAFEKRGMWGMAGAQLRRLKKSAGDAEIKIDGAKAGAGKWAELRLGSKEYRRGETGSEPASAVFPAVKAWTWTGQRGWETRVLEPESGPAWKDAPVLVVSGPSLVAIDPEKGAERWRAAVPGGVRWAAWSSGMLVVAGENAATAIREDGTVAWRTQYPGSHLFEGQEGEGAVYLAVRNERQTGSFLIAIDSATGARSWLVDMQPAHQLREFWVTDDGVAWRSRDDTAMVVADRETGAIRARWPIAVSRLTQAAPDRFLAFTWENELTLLEASTGKTLWKAPQPGMRLDGAPLVAGGCAITTMTSDDGQSMRIYDLESGKLKHEVNLGSVWVKQLVADAGAAYVAFKRNDGTNEFVAASYDLSSGTKRWQTTFKGVSTFFPTGMSQGHVLLDCPVIRQAEGAPPEWVPTIIAFDKKTGAESGRIEGRAESTPTYGMSLVPGRVVLVQGETLEAWGK